jgi:hypothetical protein
MRSIPESKACFAAIAATLVLAGLLPACATKVNQKALQAAAPRTIGVAIGHDIKAVESLSTGEEVVVGLSFGALGLLAAEAGAEERRLTFEDRLNDLVYERIRVGLEGKGYQVQRLATTPRKWNLFANLEEGPNSYRDLAKGYDLPSAPDGPDAILFFEYLVEGRLAGRIFSTGQLEALTLDNMRLMYAKSKLFLYDPKTRTRFFQNSVQRGYPPFTGTTFPDAVSTIVALEAIPPARR